MGESLVEAPKLENKMGESLTNVPCFQESVSFGRFEHDDSLCWERWSTFPSNKYLEEVEKCSTPGSVAQKKAYFEAHYKRIAARKVELLEQEKGGEAEFVNSEDQSRLSSVCNTSEEELDVEKPINQNSVELNEVGSFPGVVSDKHIDIPICSDDTLIQENRALNLSSEISDYFEEHGVADLRSEASETFEENGVMNLISEVSENFGSDAVGISDEVTDDLTGEVSEHIDEIRDEADVADELTDVAEEEKKIQPEHIAEPHYGADFIKEKQDIQPEPEDNNVDLCLKTDIPELMKSDELVLVKEDVNSSQVWHDKEVLSQEKIEERDIALAGTMKPMKLVDHMKTEKVFDKEVLSQEKLEEREIALAGTIKPVKSVDPLKPKKTTSAMKATTKVTDAKKKPASPVPKRHVASRPKSPMTSTPKSSKPEPKSPMTSTPNSLKPEPKSTMTSTPKSSKPEPKSSMTSTPKSSKPELIKPAKSATRPSIKKENDHAPLTSKKAARSESKKVLPTSLHMSLSYGPANMDPGSCTTTRKSIMESMGDKDIVKRAFRSFQNGSRLTQSSLAKPASPNQPSTEKTELKASMPNTIQNKAEGTIRSAKATNLTINHQGTKLTSQSPGLKKSIGVDQRNGKSVPASFGSRSQDLGRQQKQVPKKIEQKTAIKDAGMTNFLSKLKAEKAAENGNSSHNDFSKPRLSSSYNQGHGFLRVSVRKENSRV